MTFLLTSTIWFVLTWTAPGDDGDVGQAASYDIRMSTGPITTVNWDSCVVVPNTPLPLIAGTSQACTVWFAMTTTDDAGNESGLSNVAMGLLPTYPCADLNGDGMTDIEDMVWLVDYMFREGPVPDCGDGS